MNVEVIANSKFAAAQSSIRPNPQKVKLTLSEVLMDKIKMTQEQIANTSEEIIEDKETYLVFLSVIPKVKNPINKHAQLVNRAKPA